MIRITYPDENVTQDERIFFFAGFNALLSSRGQHITWDQDGYIR